MEGLEWGGEEGGEVLGLGGEEGGEGLDKLDKVKELGWKWRFARGRVLLYLSQGPLPHLTDSGLGNSEEKKLWKNILKI